MQNVKTAKFDRPERPASERRQLSLAIEVLEDRIAPAVLGFGVDTGNGWLPKPPSFDEYCN